MGQSHTSLAWYRAQTFLGLACLATGILLISSGCDSQDPHFDFPREFVDNFNDPPGSNLSTYEEVLFVHGNYRFRIRPEGILDRAEWNSNPSVANSKVWTMNAGGLWMSGTQQNRVRANVAGDGSNYIPTKLAVEAFSMYHFSSSDVIADISNWPDSLGAPVLESNIPAVWGDINAMATSVTGSDSEYEPYKSGFDQIQVVQTVFGIDHYRLVDVFFVRYDITNQSEDILEDVHLGIYTDTDLSYRSRSVGSLTCIGLVDYYVNRTGFDFDRRLSYTYSMPEAVEIDEPCLGIVTGYLLLETSTDNGSVVQPGSHRILRRNRSLQAGFSEKSFETAEHLHLAMKGLSTTGHSMINPITGEATKWAFTGNPVDSTGWIDYPTDVRSLLSTEAFTMQIGDHVAMTVAWITARDETLALALDEMRVLADILINNPSLWRDPK